MDITATTQNKRDYCMSLDLKRIKKELETLPNLENIKQISLQGTHDNLDPFLGVGKLRLIKGDYKETDFVVPIFDIPYINSIMKDLKMFRTRLMKLYPRECYTYHYDYTKRIHIPLVTDKNCFIIDDKQIKHLPADGNHYIVDTTKWHTALNDSAELTRTHIVGGIDVT